MPSFPASPDDAGRDPGREIPHQLLADVTFYTNHEDHLARLDRLLGSGSGDGERPTPVVVITGSPGVGKTTLATRWGHRVSDRFPDGNLHIDLRGFSDESPTDAYAALGDLLGGLGITPELLPVGMDAREGLYRTLMSKRRMLIVADNAADADQVRPLLPGGGGSFVIVTSRNELEDLITHHDARIIRLDILQTSEAVALLRQLTTAGEREDDDADLAELAELCACLPLALRVAAARAVSRPELALADLMADLRDDALNVGDGEKVRATFSWSYRHLPPEAARMFRVLGLYRGPDITPAAAGAAAGVSADDARRALDILMRFCLVDSVSRFRYRQHDLLRAYAGERARATNSEDECRAVVDRIARWYTATAYRASRLLVPGREFALDSSVLVPGPGGPEPGTFDTPRAAREWLDAERHNLVANARFARESGLPRRAWELAMVLAPVHATRFEFDDWSALSELAVTAAESTGEASALASALDNRGRYLFRRGELDRAKAAHSRALAIQEKIRDEPGRLRSLNALGLVSLAARDLPDAIGYLRKTRDEARHARQPRWYGTASVNLAHALLESGDAAEAMTILEPLPEFFTERDDQLNAGTARQLIAWAHRLGNAPGPALAEINAALAIAEDAGMRVWEANWLIEAARVHLAAGDAQAALERGLRAVSLQHQLRDPGREAMARDCSGEALSAMGDTKGAAQAHRDAARMHRSRGDDWSEALALAHLAGCEARLGLDGDAQASAARALELIDRFTDPRAAGLKADLRRRLA